MEIIITSIIAFASTNIDDLFLLTVFYANKKFTNTQILIGQFLGISALIVIGLVGSLSELFIDKSYVGLLGLIPVYLGMKGLLELMKKGVHEYHPVKEQHGSNILTVATVAMGNGGDNIGTYIPLFAVEAWTDKMWMIGIFLVMTLVWCGIAKYFTDHPVTEKFFDKYGHLVTPLVLIVLGLHILHECDTLSIPLRWLGIS